MKKNSLALNTLFLYIMQFGGYFFSLLVIPYQTRIISVEHNSQISVAVGIMLYIQMAIQFGFTVSGVKDVTENRSNKQRLNNLYSSILNIRLIISAILMVVIVVLCLCVSSYKAIMGLIMVYFVSVVLESITPTYLIRGLEDMKTVTIASLLSKVVMMVMVFLFLKNDEQYMIIPLSRLLAAVFSFAFATIYIHVKYSIRSVRTHRHELLETARDAMPYFISRIASSVYRGSNSIAFGMIYSTTMAIYTMPEKLTSIVMAMSSPVADSLLPYMVRKKDYGLIKKIIVLLCAAMLFGGVIVMFFAEEIVVLLFGSNYISSANLLRIMMPAMLVTPINYVIAFPVLIPMGYAKQSNMANVAAAIIHICVLVVLLLTNTLNFYTGAIMISFSEVFVTVWRVVLVLMHRKEIKTAN